MVQVCLLQTLNLQATRGFRVPRERAFGDQSGPPGPPGSLASTMRSVVALAEGRPMTPWQAPHVWRTPSQSYPRARYHDSSVHFPPAHPSGGLAHTHQDVQAVPHLVEPRGRHPGGPRGSRPGDFQRFQQARALGLRSTCPALRSSGRRAERAGAVSHLGGLILGLRGPAEAQDASSLSTADMSCSTSPGPRRARGAAPATRCGGPRLRQRWARPPRCQRASCWSGMPGAATTLSWSS